MEYSDKKGGLKMKENNLELVPITSEYKMGNRLKIIIVNEK